MSKNKRKAKTKAPKASASSAAEAALATTYEFKVNTPLMQIIEISGGEGEVVVLPPTKDGAQNELIQVLRSAVADQIGWSQANSLGQRWPMHLIIRHWSAIKQEADDYQSTIPDAIVAYIEAKISLAKEQLRANIKDGRIEYGDLGAVFENGAEIIGAISGETIGGTVVGTGYERGWAGNYFVIQVSMITTLGGFVGQGQVKLKIPGYGGVRSLDSLPVQLITDEEKADLTARGLKFAEYAYGAKYLHYVGQIEQASYWSSRSYRADGRVMIDCKTFAETQNDLFSQAQRARGVNIASRDDPNFELPITEENAWTCFPFLYGFSFNAKQWGELKVSGLSDINWRTDSWEKLVLPDEEKELVQALVEHHGDSFTDIVDEKGGGVIFMLSGPPGEGKTLTMETIAEFLHKPLYRVSVGELGVDPDQLEERLRNILDIATIWDAVVGLDEADIFLAKRDSENILRNAMVGVFLRLTEYHQGVLFLTTNLVDQIDEAFESRISVHISFEKGKADKRAKIWTQLLAAAKIPDGVLDVKELSLAELNGRQIKNVIRQSQTLAKARKVDLSKEIVQRVIAVSQKSGH